MEVTKRKIDIYTIRGKCEDGYSTWGEITLELGEHSAKVMANTENGTYAYNWFHTGNNPVQFLKDLDIYYAMDKLTDYKMYEPDYKEFSIDTKKIIIEARLQDYITKEEARHTWDDLIPHIDDFQNRDIIHSQMWNTKHFSKVFGDSDSMPNPTKIKPQCIQFWNNIWVPFVKNL